MRLQNVFSTLFYFLPMLNLTPHVPEQSLWGKVTQVFMAQMPFPSPN